MSREEKLAKAMAYMREKRSVFTPAILKKALGSKQVGIAKSACEKVIEEMVNDELIIQDKIGISNFVWHFPSSASLKLTTDVNAVTNESKELDALIAQCRAEIEKCEATRCNNNRKEMLQSNAEMKAELANLTSKLETMAVCDVETYEEVKRHAQTAKEAHERWTDVIHEIGSHMKRKNGTKSKDLLKQFGLPEDYDYVDDMEASKN